MADGNGQPTVAKPGEPAGSSRREFLMQAGGVVVGAGALAVVVGSVRFSMPDFPLGAEARFPLGEPSDFKTGTLTWLRERDLFVVRNERGFGAFSSRCTHLGCTVRRTAEGFFCPCHGASYDSQGRVLKGPARRHLPWYHIWPEADGLIWVDQREEVSQGTMTPSLATVRPFNQENET